MMVDDSVLPTSRPRPERRARHS